jgi:hypothetical protein
MAERESQAKEIFEELTPKDERGVLLPASKLVEIGEKFRSPEAYESLQLILESALVGDEEDQKAVLRIQNDFLLQRGIELESLGKKLWFDYRVGDPLMALCLVATSNWKLNCALYETALELKKKTGFDPQVYPSNLDDWGKSVLGIMAKQAGLWPKDLEIRGFPVGELEAAPTQEPEVALPTEAAEEKPAPAEVKVGEAEAPKPTEREASALDRGAQKVYEIPPKDRRPLLALRLEKDQNPINLIDELKKKGLLTEEETQGLRVNLSYVERKKTLFHYLQPLGSSLIVLEIPAGEEDYKRREIADKNFFPILRSDAGETIIIVAEKAFLITKAEDRGDQGLIEFTPVDLGERASSILREAVEETELGTPPSEAEISPKEEPVSPEVEVPKSFSVDGDRGNLITAMLRRKSLFEASRADMGDLQVVLKLTHKGVRTKLTVSKGELILIEEGKEPRTISGIEKDVFLSLSRKDEGKTRIRVEGCQADVIYVGIKDGKVLFAPAPREEIVTEAPTVEEAAPPPAEETPEPPPVEASSGKPPAGRKYSSIK